MKGNAPRLPPRFDAYRNIHRQVLTPGDPFQIQGQEGGLPTSEKGAPRRTDYGRHSCEGAPPHVCTPAPRHAAQASGFAPPFRFFSHVPREGFRGTLKIRERPETYELRYVSELTDPPLRPPVKIRSVMGPRFAKN